MPATRVLLLEEHWLCVLVMPRSRRVLKAYEAVDRGRPLRCREPGRRILQFYREEEGDVCHERRLRSKY